MATYTKEQVQQKAQQLGVSDSDLQDLFIEAHLDFERDGLTGIPDIDRDSVVAGWVLFKLERFNK